MLFLTENISAASHAALPARLECIAKGKDHKKYEFGCKVSLISTSESSWIVGVQAVHGNPYDGHSLKAALDQVENITAGDRSMPIATRATREHRQYSRQPKSTWPTKRKRA